jgi:hypothetical protein
MKLYREVYTLCIYTLCGVMCDLKWRYIQQAPRYRLCYELACRYSSLYAERMHSSCILCDYE